MRRILPTLLALLVLFGLYRLFRIAQQFEPGAMPAAGYAEGGLGDISIQFGGSEVTARSGDRKQWSLRADRIDLRRASSGLGSDLGQFRSADFAGIHGGTLYRDGRREATFSAATATYDRPSQQFTVRGGIRVRTVKKDTLTAPELVWSERDDYVRFPSGARGTFGGNAVNAPSLLYQPKRRIIECPQGAAAFFEGYPLRASSLTWDLKTNLVRMPGTVSGRRKGYDFDVQDAELDLKARLFHANEGTLKLRIEGGSVGTDVGVLP